MKKQMISVYTLYKLTCTHTRTHIHTIFLPSMCQISYPSANTNERALITNDLEQATYVCYICGLILENVPNHILQNFEANHFKETYSYLAEGSNYEYEIHTEKMHQFITIQTIFSTRGCL